MSEAKPAGEPEAPKRTEYVAESPNQLATREEPRVDETISERPRRDMAPLMRGGMIGLLVFAGLLFVLLLFSGLGWLRLPGFGVAAVPTRELILDESADASSVLGGVGEAYPGPPATVPPPGPPPGPPPPVNAQFEGYYYVFGGERILGRPIAAASEVNGRLVQWFERGRIEHWPEFAGTPYEVQLGRLGVEYTAGREFARQGYFVGASELRFFPETSHALGGAFMRSYDQNGGLAVFGYPISEEFDEVLADGGTYRVQYFERARMELHPELGGTPYEVQLGLLGTAMYRNESRPNTVQPIPTPVPLP